MPRPATTYLRHTENGRVFVRTDILAKAPNMVPCELRDGVPEGTADLSTEVPKDGRPEAEPLDGPRDSTPELTQAAPTNEIESKPEPKRSRPSRAKPKGDV